MFFNHLSTRSFRVNWGNSHIFCQCKEQKLNFLTVWDVKGRQIKQTKKIIKIYGKGKKIRC